MFKSVVPIDTASQLCALCCGLLPRCGGGSPLRLLSASMLRELADFIMGLRRRLFFHVQVDSRRHLMITTCVSPIGSVCETPRVVSCSEAIGQLDRIGDVVLLLIKEGPNSIIFRDEMKYGRMQEEPRKATGKTHNSAMAEAPADCKWQWRFSSEMRNAVKCNCNSQWVVAVVSSTKFMHIWKVIDTIPQEPHSTFPLDSKFGESPFLFQFSCSDSRVPAGDELSILSCVRNGHATVIITLFILDLAKSYNSQTAVLLKSIVLQLNPVGTGLVFPPAVCWNHQSRTAFIPVTTEDHTHTGSMITKLYRIGKIDSESVPGHLSDSTGYRVCSGTNSTEDAIPRLLPTAQWIFIASDSRFILRDVDNKALYHLCDVCTYPTAEGTHRRQKQLLFVDPSWGMSFQDYFLLMTTPNPDSFASATISLLDIEIVEKRTLLASLTFSHCPGSHPQVTFAPNS
ncbi:hypothetical protein Pelo_12382 [Pelomyxa schiedti]|nr:hypothetical protein Pelo_12382 [Pelomyxa schiedti]